MTNVVQHTGSDAVDLEAYSPSKFSVVEDDSNRQASTTTGGENHFITSESGSDAAYQAAMGPGGRELL